MLTLAQKIELNRRIDRLIVLEDRQFHEAHDPKPHRPTEPNTLAALIAAAESDLAQYCAEVDQAAEPQP